MDKNIRSLMKLPLDEFMLELAKEDKELYDLMLKRLEEYQVKKTVDISGLTERVNKLVDDLFSRILEILDEKAYIEVSETFSAKLILDRLDNIHLVDNYNHYTCIIETKGQMFLHMLYYISESEWCYDDGQDINYFINSLKEIVEDDDYDLEILDDIERWVENV